MALRGNQGSDSARRSLKGRFFAWCAGAIAVLSLGCLAASPAFAIAFTGQGDIRSLTLHNLHTNETATIVFKRNGVYDQDGLKALDTFLRDPIDLKSTTNMDPHLFDLLWDVYQQTAATSTIQVLDGYRSPVTNEYLRKNSDGVAENSLHMKGEAIDFYIPGVALATLRNVGLKEQAGGVGFYPDSGSPFVHLDTGSVRHWPLLSRQQLLAVFPEGKTLDIPADGNPLPGYKDAQAAYQQRQAALTPVTQVASFSADDGMPKQSLFNRFVDNVIKAAPPTVVSPNATPAAQPAGVAVASYSAPSDAFLASAPKPNLAPKPPQPTVVATLTPVPKPVPLAVKPTQRMPVSPRAADFASPDFWKAPSVPAPLAVAMAAKTKHDPASSLPIAPTAVVATISVNRAAVDAITSAVIRGDSASLSAIPAVLAYAAEPVTPIKASVQSAPARQAAPTTVGSIPAAPAKPAPVALAAPPPLTLTALDTAGLRLWMGSNSTRQRTYATMTMPDFAPTAALMAAPSAGLSSFSATPATLRTDRFAPDAR